MAFATPQTFLVFLIVISSFTVDSMARSYYNLDQDNLWRNDFNRSESWPYKSVSANQTASRRIIVGGSQKWRYGYNYTDWALTNSPFYLNDTLVFQYDAPSENTFPHSVYLLPNLWSFMKCDLRRAKRIADPSEGEGKGFEFVLKSLQPHYFVCGEHNGIHCKNGTMKFAVMPLLRPRY